MKTHSTIVHLEGDETVRVTNGGNLDAIYIEDSRATTSLVLPHWIPAHQRVLFLRDLAASAIALADDIMRRDETGAA